MLKWQQAIIWTKDGPIYWCMYTSRVLYDLRDGDCDVRQANKPSLA